MKIKICLKYIIYLFIVFIMVYLKEYIGIQFTNFYESEFRPNFFYIAMNLTIGIALGLLLGINHFYSEFRKKGSWKFNIYKLIFLCIPSLFFSITNFIMYSEFLQNIIPYPLIKLSIQGSNYIYFFQVFLGYTIISSIYKK